MMAIRRVATRLIPANSSHTTQSAEDELWMAPQWKLIWWKFRKHKLALFSLYIVLAIYFIAIFAEFIAPFDPGKICATHTYAPPQRLALLHDGRFEPHVKGYQVEVDTESMRRVFTTDDSQIVSLGLFVHGTEYRLFGLIKMDIHLFGPKDPDQPVYVLGADRLGRDMLSRIIYGARISMSIGLVGVIMSLTIGIVLGGISGYYGGVIDNFIQRLIELVRSIPSIPLWMGLAAALPLAWPPLRVYFVITIILSLLGWASLARVVRGRFLALRSENFVLAARLDGAKERKIIFQHMLPAFYSHIIASITLAIPSMILAETSLSFLGIGLRSPIISWGVLLQEAQNIRTIATAPWLLIPAIPIITAVVSLNFLGDGLRDAADPYA
jgi:peptide/nickel transport system permease protein